MYCSKSLSRSPALVHSGVPWGALGLLGPVLIVLRSGLVLTVRPTSHGQVRSTINAEHVRVLKKTTLPSPWKLGLITNWPTLLNSYLVRYALCTCVKQFGRSNFWKGKVSLHRCHAALSVVTQTRAQMGNGGSKRRRKAAEEQQRILQQVQAAAAQQQREADERCAALEREQEELQKQIADFQRQQDADDAESKQQHAAKMQKLQADLKAVQNQAQQIFAKVDVTGAALMKKVRAALSVQ